MELSAEEARVVGSLIEKQLTTPQQYPLTLNALVMACNQSSNRDPVVSYDERTVEDTLDALKADGLLRFLHPSHGRSATRYRQVLEERMGLDERQLALIGVLLLRGPQTIGELRARTERMADLGPTAALEAELEQMSTRSEPLVQRLARRPGQKEERWAQLLTAGAQPDVYPSRRPVLAEPEIADRPEALARPSLAEQGSGQRLSTGDGEQTTALGDLAEQVSVLRSEVAELRMALADLQAQLGV